MKIFDDYSDHYDETVRLTMLKAIGDDPGEMLNETMLHKVLDDFAFRRNRAYVRSQMMWLANAVGAVLVREINGIMVAKITPAGKDHLDGRTYLDGIRIPSTTRGW